MIDIIKTALQLNNSVTLTKIPYHYLTRKENQKLIDLDKLSMQIQMTKYVQPFVHYNIEDQLKLDYQILCKDHMKELLENFETIYISMEHLAEYIKDDFKDFYYSDMYKQFHIVFQLIDWNDDEIIVEPITLNEEDFLTHQDIARRFELNFNLKYNLKTYMNCPFCFPTIAGMGFYYKELYGKLPYKLSMIDDRFSKALVLIKNDRVNIENLNKVAQFKWKCFTYKDYGKKLKLLGEKNQWDFNRIISDVHKTHYRILKACEHIKDRESNVTSWKSKSDSPSWRK